MKRNMKEWRDSLLKDNTGKSFPLLSTPAVGLLGISVKEMIHDSDKIAKGLAMIAERTEAVASAGFMDLSVEAECFGATIHESDDEVPTVSGSLITEEDEADDLAVPELGTGRTGTYIDAIGKAADLISDRPMFAGTIGPFSLASRLMGVEDALYNCYDEPDMVHTLLEKATEFIIKYALGFKEAGANGIVMAEPVTGLISKTLADEFSHPYVKQIIDAVQDDSFAVIYHNCGSSVTSMPADIFALGAYGYHFGNAIDIEDMLKSAPDDCLVFGNISPSGEFLGGTPASMEKAVTELIARCGKYKSFVISSGCDIPPQSPWENIEAFFRAVK